MTTRVLVVSQRADRTGAPIQLATILDGVREHLVARITLLVGSPGGLCDVLAPLVDELVVEPKILRRLRRASARAPGLLRGPLARLGTEALRHRTGTHDVLYVNSLLSTSLAASFSELPTIVHVHEVGTFADVAGPEGLELLQRAEAVIAVSQPVRAWLLQDGIPDSRIRVIPGSVGPRAFDRPPPADVDALRRRIGIEGDAFVVSSVGWFGDMKGSDRFVEVAALVRDRVGHDRPVRFVWIGGNAGTNAGREFTDLVRARSLEQVVTPIAGMDDLRVLYGASDVVMVASREESLSLVALEGAAQGRPVVCFPGAGGPDELAVEGVTVRAAAADADAMADLVVDLAASGEHRADLGARARAAVRRHHDADDARRATAAVIRSVIDANTTSVPRHGGA